MKAKLTLSAVALLAAGSVLAQTPAVEGPGSYYPVPAAGQGGYGTAAPGYGMGPGPGRMMGPGSGGMMGPGYGMGPAPRMAPGAQSARGPGYGPVAPSQPGPRGPAMTGRTLDLVWLLDLDEGQRMELVRINQDLRRERWRLMGEMMQEADKLWDLYVADPVDAQAVGAVYDAIFGYQRALIVRGIEAGNAARAQLSESQQDQLRRLRLGLPPRPPEPPER